MGRANEDHSALSRHREDLAGMLRSLTVRGEELLGQAPELVLDLVEMRGFNAVHLVVPNLEQNETGFEFLAAAERRKVPVYAHLELFRQEQDRGLSPVNALGQQFSGHECPSQPVAQDHCLAYCEHVGKMYGWAGMEITGLGFRNFGAAHEIGSDVHFYRSICFCSACQYGYGAAGAILEHVAREVINEPFSLDAKHPSVDTMLLWRRSVQYGILRQIREMIPIPLCLRTAAELRYTGDSSSLTFEEAKGLVAACSVDLLAGDGVELARLAALARPMPIYCCALTAEAAEISQHHMFSGHIQ